MEASSTTSSKRPSLVSRSLRNSFRRFKVGVSSSSSIKKNFEGSPVSTTGLPSPISLLDVKEEKGYEKDGSPAKDVPFSPIQLESRDIPVVGNEPSSSGPLMDLLGRLRSDSQKKRDSGGSVSKPKSALRLHRRRQVVQVDEAEKVNLLSRLRSTLQAIENSLHFNEKDLENHLEDHDYVIDRAASEFLERTGLRQVEPNTTLKKIEFKDDNPDVHNAWSICDPSVFTVRYGPQYRKSRIKAPAKPQTIYDMVAVDMYSSEEKIEHMSRFMKLGELERDEGSHPLPSVFIVNFMLPLNEPRMFSGDANGPTVAFHFIMKLSSWAKQNPDHPSVQLVAKFINESGSSGSMRERLKIIVQVANPDELQLGKIERGLCRQYNGLPFLYRTYNSKYHRGFGWFQADFDAHKSGYATRLARHSLLGWANQIVANVAILVESETDEEMPERILGCANLHRLSCRSARPFQKPMAVPLSPISARRREKTSSLLSEDSLPENQNAHKDSFASENDDDFKDALAEDQV